MNEARKNYNNKKIEEILKGKKTQQQRSLYL